MSEISFHYHGGVITFKHKNQYAERTCNTGILDEKGFLPLLTIELADLSCLKEFEAVGSSLNDVFFPTPWKISRGLFFILSKEEISQLAVLVGTDILGIYDLQDVDTGIFLKIVDYHLSSQNIPKSPMRVITYKGTAEQKLYREDV
jgi:hypothetical protein